MGHLTGQLDNSSIIDVIRSIFLHRATGVLEIRREEKERRFYFVDGELYLPGSHGLAKHLAELLEAEALLADQAKKDELADSESGLGDDGPDYGEVSPFESAPEGSSRRDSRERAEAVGQLQALVGRIVDVLVDWKEGHFSFDTESSLADDLVGPLPTAYLIMEGSVRDLSEEDMLRELGGEQVLVAADTESDLVQQLPAIDPGEMFLLSRLERPVSLAELLRQIPGTRYQALRMLCRLKAVDLVLLPRELGAKRSPEPPRHTDAVVDKFLERIGSRLKDDPLELDPREHRARVGELVGAFGSLNFYELLGVSFHADDRELHQAYEELARITHPSHASSIKLDGKEELLRLVFERATMAYLTLADSERRAAYNVEAAVDASRLTPPAERNQEQSDLAKGHYEQAMKLEASSDYHFAMELARQAIRNDPRPEYFALLGRIQSHNPNWIEQSSESYRQAIRRDPDNPEYRVALARVMEKAGETVRAKMHYRAALQRAPETVEAQDALNRLTGRAASVRQDGLMARIKKLFARQ